MDDKILNFANYIILNGNSVITQQESNYTVQNMSYTVFQQKSTRSTRPIEYSKKDISLKSAPLQLSTNRFVVLRRKVQNSRAEKFAQVDQYK